MSLLFGPKESMKPARPEPTKDQMATALAAIAAGDSNVHAARKGKLLPSRCDALVKVALMVEPMVLAQIAAGDLHSEAEAATEAERIAPPGFPGAKFVEILRTNAGGSWADLVFVSRNGKTAEPLEM